MCFDPCALYSKLFTLSLDHVEDLTLCFDLCALYSKLFTPSQDYVEDLTLCFDLFTLSLDQLQNMLALIVEVFQFVFNALVACCCQ